MTGNERIQIQSATNGLFYDETEALCGSIRNYRKGMERKEGRSVSFEEALREWTECVFRPLVWVIRHDETVGRIMGHDRYRVFFPSLYELEARGFAFSSDIPGMMAMRMAKDDSAGHLSAGKAV